MRIHTNTLTAEDIYDAARAAGAVVETCFRHGSRTHDHAYELKLTGNSRQRPNGGSYGADRDAYAYAATWDQWGVVLGLLFDIDATMRTTYDKSKGDFHYRTAWRFDDLNPENITIPLSHDHVFRFNGMPGEQMCLRCHAIQRWVVS